MTRLIDADVLMTWFDNHYDHEEVTVGYVSGLIKDAPTVQAFQTAQDVTIEVPVRHGKWIYGNDFHWYTASCSACGYQRRTDIKATGWNQWKYCPNCGAKMDAERRPE